MMNKSMVKSAWAEDMGQFLYHLDPNTRKITRSLEKIKLKIINKQSSIIFNKTCLNNNLLPKYHHHHIALAARISLTLSRHSSLSFIALGRSSGQQPVSSHSC